jgi:hypothetical protein
MFRAYLLGSLFLAGCATGNVERHRLADGSWQFTCKLSMDECVRHVEQVCSDKRYRILAGNSQNIVRDVPPGTREYHTSDLTVTCGDEGAPSPEGAGPTLARPAASAGPVCVAGTTQACVGTAGCAGGQACRPDGTGYGPCDCGTAPAKTSAVVDAGSTGGDR